MMTPAYMNVCHDWHKYLERGYDGQAANWIMNNDVNLIASNIASWTGVSLLIGEWPAAAPVSATITDAIRSFRRSYSLEQWLQCGVHCTPEEKTGRNYYQIGRKKLSPVYVQFIFKKYNG